MTALLSLVCETTIAALLAGGTFTQANAARSVASLGGAFMDTCADVILRHRIEAAIKAGTSPAEFEKVVGIPSIATSLTEDGRDAFRALGALGSFQADTEFNEVLPRRPGVKAAILWQRPSLRHKIRFIGVNWDAQDRPTVYYGVIVQP